MTNHNETTAQLNADAPRSWWRKWWILGPVGLLTMIVLAAVFVVTMTQGSSGTIPIHEISQPTQNNILDRTTDGIQLLSINMAHGRGDGGNQMFRSDDVFSKNISAISDIIQREQADIVALQEADVSSWWNGSYSHVLQLAKESQMPLAIQGKNVDGLGLAYGAAVLSRIKIIDAQQQTFAKSFPTFSKGCVIATCEWPGDTAFTFDLVSLHLDFASASVRISQLKHIAEILKQNNRPVILIGDFNSDANAKLISNFMQKLQLHTWKPDDQDIVTFPTLGTRIDWILVSKEFIIREHVVLEDIVSDHLALRVFVQRAP